jgi:hypothetical protein
MEEAALPARVQEALVQLVGAAKEGLLALSVGVGLGVGPEPSAGRRQPRFRVSEEGQPPRIGRALRPARRTQR